MQSIVKGTLAGATAAGATYTYVSYPTGKTPGHFKYAMGHKLALAGGALLSFPNDFDITLNAIGTGISLVNKTASAWPANTDFILELQEIGQELEYSPGAGAMPGVTKAEPVHVNLGSPVVGATNALVATAGLTTSAAGVEKLTTPVDLITPRGVSITSAAAGDNSAFSVKFTGRDVYGKVMVETVTFNGAATVAGLKAFKWVDSIKFIHASGTSLTGAINIGTTNVLGLPVQVLSPGYIIKELQDGAIVGAAGTLAVGIRTAGGSTATTGDVRGTYTPNSAPDGAKAYSLIILIEKDNRGIPQFAG